MDSTTMRTQLARLTDDIKEIRDQGRKAKDDPNEVWLFRGMMCNIKESFSTYETIYNDLSMYIDGEEGSILTNVDRFQRAAIKRYFHESHGYLSLIDGAMQAVTPQASDTTVVVSQVNSGLPNIKFPKFNGDRTKWPRFKDTFVSLVTDDVALPNIKKFHYLLDALEGPPLAVIAKFTVTSDNFPLAWAALEKQYDNKRLIAASYLDQLLDIKPLTSKPNDATLNKLVSTLAENISAFKLVEITNRVEFLYFHLASRCLDTTTREQFELQNRDTFPTFDK